MATQQKKKAVTPGSRNPERRNGKAWKKPSKPKPVRTPEKELAYQLVLSERARKKEANLLRRQAALQAAEEAARMKEEDIANLTKQLEDELSVNPQTPVLPRIQSFEPVLPKTREKSLKKIRDTDIRAKFQEALGW